MLTVSSTPDRTALHSFFNPVSVAVIGATDREGSVGRTVLANLVRGSYHGRVFAVNPRHSEILGIKCYPNVSALPAAVDLAVIVTPAPTVPGVDPGMCRGGRALGNRDLRRIQGARRGGSRTRAADSGEQLRRRADARHRPELPRHHESTGGPERHLRARHGIARQVSHFSAKAAPCETAILDWSLLEQVGFSAMVSTGSMLDVGWGDLIDYFGSDPDTHSILLYMESVGDARSFLSAAREVALRKPIIVIKAGRSEAASKAAVSHTGALTGSDEVFDAALRRCGVLRVDTIGDLFYMAETLARQPRPRGPRLTDSHQRRWPRRARHRFAHRSMAANSASLSEIIASTLSASSCPRTGATEIRSTFSATPTPSLHPRLRNRHCRIPHTDGFWPSSPHKA